MSLRLVSNVHALPVGNMRDIVAAARGFADTVESGEIHVSQCVLVAVVDGTVDYVSWGDPIPVAFGIGLLEMASRKIEYDARA